MSVAKERVFCKNKGYANFFGGFHSKESKGGSTIAQHRWYPHMLGLLGEIAYSRMFGDPLDLSFRKMGDKGFDFKDGVEVKTRKCKDKNPWLMVRKNDFIRKPAEKYVLCRLEPPTEDINFEYVEFLGYITYKDFKRKGEELEMPGRTNWVVRAEELTPFKED